MSLFYSYIAGPLYVSGPRAHPQESSYSCSHNHWFSFCATLFADNIQSKRTERHRHWTNGRVNSCTNSPEDGPVGPKHVEIQQYTNKIVTSVGFHSIYLYRTLWTLCSIARHIVMLVQGRVDMGSASISTVPWSVSLPEGVWEVVAVIDTHPRFGGNLGGKA